jgi:hypothetical protein
MNLISKVRNLIKAARTQRGGDLTLDYKHAPLKPSKEMDWDCYLMPVSILQSLNQLPVHESCKALLEHIVVPAAQRTPEAVRAELSSREVCAVSWRWSGLKPASAKRAALDSWSPMSDQQLRRLKEFVAQSQCKYVWIDWTCVPQLSSDTMRFINASYDVYSSAQSVVFLPRLKELRRRGWPALSPQTFSELFRKTLRDVGRVERIEAALRAGGEKTVEFRAQVESALDMLLRLLEGEAVVYPTFDYYARAWTLAERLAAFKPSSESPIRLGEMHNAGDAMLYAMSGFWRDVQSHADAYTNPLRPSLTESDIYTAVYLRGVDSSDEDVRELWDDMNHMVQLSPGILGVSSETAALAVICVEWLLHRSIGASDDLGKFTATLLGECVTYTAAAIANATLHEEANVQWFRKYLYFQAGSLYSSTIPQDLILAVYRSCGLPERDTAKEAIQSCLQEVFGDSAESVEQDFAQPGIDKLCREALRHDELHVHISSRGDGKRNLSASDFNPLLPPARKTAPIDASQWNTWLMRTGIVTCWWWSKIDQALPVGATEYFDIEQLYCEDLTELVGLSLEDVFRSTASIVYKLHRRSDKAWQLVHISFSRRAGQCGEGLSQFRTSKGLKLENLLGPDIIRNGRAQDELLAAWNQRCLQSLDDDLHYYWGQCAFSQDVLVAS